MTTDSEFAIPTCNASDDAAGEDHMQPSRTRESVPAADGRPAFVTARDRRWRRAPVPHEGAEASAKSRSPFTEDLPSPRCVTRDYREGAAVVGHETPVGTAAYWVFAFIPFLAHWVVAVPSHYATQRPSRFWAVVIVTVIVLAAAGVF